MAPCLFMCMYMNICMCMGSGLNIGIKNFANPDFYMSRGVLHGCMRAYKVTDYDKNLKIKLITNTLRNYSSK